MEDFELLKRFREGEEKRNEAPSQFHLCVEFHLMGQIEGWIFFEFQSNFRQHARYRV